MSCSFNTVVHQYYAEMQNSIKTNKLNYANLLFAEDAFLVGPAEKFVGRKALEPLYNQFISSLENFQIKRQVGTDESVCSIIVYKTKFSPQKIEMAEWIEVEEGKIVELRVYFDTTAWNKATRKRTG